MSEGLEAHGPNIGILHLSSFPWRHEKEWATKPDSEWLRNLIRDRAKIRYVCIPREGVPDTIEEDLIVCSGSDYTVYEKNMPHFQKFNTLIRKIVSEQRKVFVAWCYGHQQTLGAFQGSIVTRGHKGPETATTSLTLTDAGKQDWFFRGVDSPFEIATSHSDVVQALPTIPGMSVRELAYNDKYRLQAVAIGDLVRTLQPHPDMDGFTISHIMRTRIDTLLKAGVYEKDDEVLEAIDVLKERNDVQHASQIIIDNVLIETARRKAA